MMALQDTDGCDSRLSAPLLPRPQADEARAEQDEREGFGKCRAKRSEMPYAKPWARKPSSPFQARQEPLATRSSRIETPQECGRASHATVSGDANTKPQDISST